MSVAEQQRCKAEDLMGEAEQKLNETGGKCCGGGKSRARVEEACDLYVKAGNAFKMAKEWHRAGSAFAEAAAIQLENGRKNESGMHYVEAAKCYKKVSHEDCEQCLLKATEVYSDVGRGKTVAKQYMTLAELYEEQGNLEKAVEQFQLAADMFSGEELASSTTKCLLSVATHSATLGDFERAEQIFEQLGESSLSNKLLKYTACEHFARAGLCRLASKPQDGDGLLKKIAEWKESSPAFAESRECTWLIRMADACQKESLDDLNEAVRTYESVTRLSKWEENLLKRIRKHIGPDLR